MPIESIGTSVLRRRFAGSLLAAIAAVFCVSAVQAQHGGGAGPIPSGPGSDIVGVACTQCHSPNAFAQIRQSPDAWRRQVHDMILRGAQVQPGEIEQVVGYLATHYGPGINVPPAAVPGRLPEGAGRSQVEQNCALCHGLDRVMSARRTSAEWDAIMVRMRELGSPASGVDATAIADYLKAHAGLR
jgi:mono/diheme cytochrome c family protein